MGLSNLNMIMIFIVMSCPLTLMFLLLTMYTNPLSAIQDFLLVAHFDVPGGSDEENRLTFLFTE